MAFVLELEKSFRDCEEYLKKASIGNFEIFFCFISYLCRRKELQKAADELSNVLLTSNDFDDVKTGKSSQNGKDYLRCLIAFIELCDYLGTEDKFTVIFDQENDFVKFSKAQFLINQSHRLLQEGKVSDSQARAVKANELLCNLQNGDIVDVKHLQSLRLKSNALSQSKTNQNQMDNDMSAIQSSVPAATVDPAIAIHLPSSQLPAPLVFQTETVVIKKQKEESRIHRKAKKKAKIPAHVPSELVGKPDPDRWLPLKDRVNKRGRRGKQKKDQAMGFGHQGGKALEGESFIPQATVTTGKVVQHTSKRPGKQKSKGKSKGKGKK
ncbi:hypothetical protein GEMRC1_002420 [Eukaryota sp. GEM-RC1]